MGIQAPAQVKYGLICKALQSDNNLLSITLLCQIAGVSRSGYYGWLESASFRIERDDADQRDFDLVLEAYRFRDTQRAHGRFTCVFCTSGFA